MTDILNYFLHIDTYLISFVSHYGAFTYFMLFAVIFCETGLVVTPFLPGDSLLFAAGSIAANATHALNIQLLFIILLLASILGNKVNYFIGRFVGPKIFTTNTSRFLNKRYLAEAHAFYEKHGGKTLIFARFIPIIRTFAPFVAGVSYMSVSVFSFYNIVSGLLWIGSLLSAGYLFGNIPIIQANFSLVIYGIILLSIAPALLMYTVKKLKNARN